MKRSGLILILGMFTSLLWVSAAAAHCEIPCGIYDDKLRVELIAEHATTIEKSMQKIIALGQAKPVNYNQLIRWVSNKEQHADEVQEIVTQYFMTQRIKPNMAKYTQFLTVLHKMLVAAMKCKQTTDLTQVRALRTLLKDFERIYFRR